MKMPLSMIQSFLPLEMTPEKIGETLTLLGIEVDQIHDHVFELSLTPNLGHCMSALGIARELSAALQVPLKKREKREVASWKKLDLKVEVQECPRYMCRLIEGVVAEPSPAWLQKALEQCGQKPINKIVDATNYVMLKVGQPLHAFDFDLLEGKTLHVGPAKTAQKFVGVDGIEREIPAGALVISDEKKVVALAGVMGGLNSAVSPTTKRVLLEAAYFDPIATRKTAKKVGLRTEGAQRFEKGVDPDGLEAALDEACELMGGKVVGGASVSHKEFIPKQISYRPERINRLLGTKLSTTEIEEIFQRLGFHCVTGKVEVPLYRTDISEEIDLVEEVARIYGYNNIDKPPARCAISPIPNDPAFVFETEIRRSLSALGLFEFLNCDLISPKLAEISREITPPSMRFLETVYSKSEEYSHLRTSLLPGLLQSLKGNLAQKNQTVAAFEIGRIHFMQENQPVEIPMAAILLTGKARPAHWSYKAADVDFFDLKGMVENLFKGHFVPSSHFIFHPGRQADMHAGELVIGSLGEVHPAFLAKFDIGQRVYYAELNLSHLLKLKKTARAVSSLAQYPASERDWTLSLKPQDAIDTILQAIQAARSPLLEKVELIDLYAPEPSAQKNATFRFTYRDLLKTISFEEVEAQHTKLIEQVTKTLAK